MFVGLMCYYCSAQILKCCLDFLFLPSCLLKPLDPGKLTSNERRHIRKGSIAFVKPKQSKDFIQSDGVKDLEKREAKFCSAAAMLAGNLGEHFRKSNIIS